MTDPKWESGIRIAQIYLETASFRHREDHLNFPHTTPPDAGQVGVELEAGFSEDQRQALVRVRVASAPKSEGMYSFEVVMVALLRVDEQNSNMPLDRYVVVAGTTLLYPFVREAVANLTTRGRFGPVWLAPFNTQAAWKSAGPEEAAEKSETRPMTRRAHVGPRRRQPLQTSKTTLNKGPGK